MDIDTVIDNFVGDLEFESLEKWAVFCDVEVNYPATGDMWPDWENELRTEVCEAMGKVMDKK